MLKVALLLYLGQIQGADAPHHPIPRGTEQIEQRVGTDGDESSEPVDFRKLERSYEEREFIKRFNELMNAMFDFASSYNTGHVIDARKAKSVRKALRELEKSDWFRPTKED